MALFSESSNLGSVRLQLHAAPIPMAVPPHLASPIKESCLATDGEFHQSFVIKTLEISYERNPVDAKCEEKKEREEDTMLPEKLADR